MRQFIIFLLISAAVAGASYAGAACAHHERCRRIALFY